MITSNELYELCKESWNPNIHFFSINPIFKPRFVWKEKWLILTCFLPWVLKQDINENVPTMSKILRSSKRLWNVFCSPFVLSTRKERMFPTSPTVATTSNITPSTRKMTMATGDSWSLLVTSQVSFTDISKNMIESYPKLTKLCLVEQITNLNWSIAPQFLKWLA